MRSRALRLSLTLEASLLQRCRFDDEVTAAAYEEVGEDTIPPHCEAAVANAKKESKSKSQGKGKAPARRKKSVGAAAAAAASSQESSSESEEESEESVSSGEV